jgi:hypothetical protein
MKHTLAFAVSLVLACASPLCAADYSIKTAEAAPPEELDSSIRKLLGDRAVQLLDGQGELVLELWLRKEVPAQATAAQVENGLTYEEVPATTLMGAVRLAKEGSDYRKQTIPAGVYTLRLAFQPPSDDHMGTAPHTTFFLASRAADDRKPGTMAFRHLIETSKKITENHPTVFLVFPGDRKLKDLPRLVNSGKGHEVLFYHQDVKAAGRRTLLIIGLTLIGASAAA